MTKIRVLIADGRMPLALLASALLAACATSSEPAAPTVVRTRAPVAYEKTVNNYLAFKLRPQKNTRVSIAPPEPGDCPLDGTPSSIRGWVVPVTHETFSGELTGRDTIRITAKPYWFWFNGETIAGITPRADQCPGIVSAFDEAKPRATTTPVGAPVTPVAARAEAAETPHSAPTAKSKKKKATSSPAKQPGTTAKAKEPAPPKPPE